MNKKELMVVALCTHFFIGAMENKGENPKKTFSEYEKRVMEDIVVDLSGASRDKVREHLLKWLDDRNKVIDEQPVAKL